MSTSKSIEVRLISTDLTPALDGITDAVHDATRLRMAVAFMTGPGVTELRSILQRLKQNSPDDPRFAKVVVGISWPTDIRALVKLAAEFPSVIRIHRGWYKSNTGPVEKKKAKLHSKVLSLKRPQGCCTLLVGSHNWTNLALQGKNREASIRIDCDHEDDFAKDLRQHVRDCWGDLTTEPTTQNLHQLLAIQKHLFLGDGKPPPWPNAPLPLEQLPTLVLIARTDEPALPTMSAMRVGFDLSPPADDEVRTRLGAALVLGRPLWLFLGHTADKGVFTRFEGVLTLANDVVDAAVDGRDLEALLDVPLEPGLGSPPKLISASSISPKPRTAFQVVARVSRSGRGQLPVMHRGSHPKVPFPGLRGFPPRQPRMGEGMRARVGEPWQIVALDEELSEELARTRQPILKVPFLDDRRMHGTDSWLEKLESMKVNATSISSPDWACPWFFEIDSTLRE